ncbi:unnamed protein product [Dracunculus medinensis]|uniref:G_PROTEIN_RECEP_F1_2 domain-containing protein n=1 Tax=Dracunculus medinensis TaxID=318479 RepID=A0A0N4UIK7_DRAME|nr:unnamed protein product [Dracunculus medinensis]
MRNNDLTRLDSNVKINNSIAFEGIHEMEWCFDIVLYYSSIGDEQSQAILQQLSDYSRFSFAINGILTCLIAVFGLNGNVFLLWQVILFLFPVLFINKLIHRTRYFSRRLACHIAMLCVWDITLLLCCVMTYGMVSSNSLNLLGRNLFDNFCFKGVIALYYKITPVSGFAAYILYFFQPLASFCVTATIWQVFAMTVERYLAVMKPLEQQLTEARFSIKSICIFIISGAFILNISMVPFERYFTTCYQFLKGGNIVFQTMVVQYEITNNPFYAIFVHLIPDLIFRAPLPIILIAVLTARTLHKCQHRQVGNIVVHLNQRRSISFMLTTLNVKFILCNTLYMINTVLIEVLGYGGKTRYVRNVEKLEGKKRNIRNFCSSQNDQYVHSLYLTDLSNMLLAIHSATNWLLFYRWTSWKEFKLRNEKININEYSYGSLNMQYFTIQEGQKNYYPVHSAEQIGGKTIEDILNKFSPWKHTLCLESPRLASKLVANYENMKDLINSENIHRHGEIVGDFIEEMIVSMRDKSTVMQVRCRDAGFHHKKAKVAFTSNQWKLMRDILIRNMVANTFSSNSSPGNDSILNKSIIKISNIIIGEMRRGALCASVDNEQMVNIVIFIFLSFQIWITNYHFKMINELDGSVLRHSDKSLEKTTLTKQYIYFDK